MAHDISAHVGIVQTPVLELCAVAVGPVEVGIVGADVHQGLEVPLGKHGARDADGDNLAWSIHISSSLGLFKVNPKSSVVNRNSFTASLAI